MRAKLAALLLAALPALAVADYDAGMTAYNKGDYETALAQFRALADRAAVAISNIRLYSALKEANEELARVAQMKDEFLASMSHGSNFTANFIPSCPTCFRIRAIHLM